MPVDINTTLLPKLFFTLSESAAGRFSTVLQSGLYIQSTKQMTVRKFLLSLPGFTEDYIAERVQTVFLDGDAIDDFDINFSCSHPVLALSAAMPGLAGAIFRKESIAAPLRKSAKKQTDHNDSGSLMVRLKLFNNIATERGPELLTHGIIFSSQDLAIFLNLRPSLIDAMANLACNDIALTREDLKNVLSENDYIFMTCRISHEHS